MLVTEREKQRRDIHGLVKRLGKDRSALVPILQEVQGKYSQVGEWAMQIIADLLDIHPVEVFATVSFYKHLDHAPRGKFTVSLVDCISHRREEKEATGRQLRNDLGIDFDQTTADGKFTLRRTGCIGMCDQGPVVQVNERVYTQANADAVHAILEDCRRSFGIFATLSRDEALR